MGFLDMDNILFALSISILLGELTYSNKLL